MTLVATISGNEPSGESALVLKLPKTSSEGPPEFSEAYYTTTYEENASTLEFDPSIHFSNIDDPEELTVTLDSM